MKPSHKAISWGLHACSFKLLAEALARIEEARTAQATLLGKDLAQEWRLRIAGPAVKGEKGRRRYTEPASLPSYT